MAASFYALIEPDPEIGRGYVELNLAIANLTRKKRFAEATAVRGILAHVFRQFESLGTRGANKADVYIRDRIRQSQVRPDTSGRLAAAVQSRPLTSPGSLPGGGVGIASITALDKGAVDPRYPRAGAYWRAQEYGTTAHVGRIVPGYFQFTPGGGATGGSRPSAAEFRVHPYFDPVLGQRGTPAMVITRPLIARNFLRDGTDSFVGWHVLQTERILAQAISRIRALRIV